MSWNEMKTVYTEVPQAAELQQKQIENNETTNNHVLSEYSRPLKTPPDVVKIRPAAWTALLSNRRGLLVLIGAVLVQLTLGTVFTTGNLSPYLISYLRRHNEPNVTRDHIVWLSAMQSGGQGLLMPLGGILERRIGSRMAGLLGSTIMSCGTAVTYFTIPTTYTMVLLTYGAICGMGVSIGYISMIAVGMRWFPNNRGAVNGITIGAFGFGSFIFNLVQTAFLNPENVSPGNDGYFVDEDVLSRVPNVFLVLGATYAVFQLIGCLLLTNPPMDLVPIDGFQPSLSPGQALQTKEFYMLFFTFLLNNQAVVYFNSMYKTFGQTFIEDDQFLAFVGALCAVFNAGGRVAWGFLIDRYRYKKCMAALCTHLCIFLLTMQFTKVWGKNVFAIWACLLFVGLAGSFTLISTCVCQTYGPKHAGTIYGMEFFSAVVSGPMNAVITQYLSKCIGFNGMFYLLAGFAFLSLIITSTFNERSIATEWKSSNTIENKSENKQKLKSVLC